MTAVNSARRTAGKAANSNLLEGLTRIGFVGYGLVHLVVAWLGLQIALGRPSATGDQSGAFQTLARQPLGRFVLIATAVGLAAMAVWQLLQALVGHRQERGSARTFERLASAGRTVIYSALAWTAGRIVAGSPTSSADQQQNATAGALAHPLQRWLIVLCGLGVVALGIGMAVYGARRMFKKKLMIERMSATTRRVVEVLGQVGYLAKGLAFTILGVLLVQAVVTRDPTKSRGLDAALRTLAAQPYGTLLLIVVALGFAAFGVYCFFQSRYRKV
jgi:hypothetical protein